jgi:hypothetical protein
MKFERGQHVGISLLNGRRRRQLNELGWPLIWKC